MSEPKRYIGKAIIRPPHPDNLYDVEAVEDANGDWVAWEDYSKLKSEVERLTAENASVKLGNAELRQMVIERGETAVEDIRVICRLEAEVERLTKAVMHSPVAQLKLKELEGKTTFDEINPKGVQP
jgi:regulator of replication initiation timing